MSQNRQSKFFFFSFLIYDQWQKLIFLFFISFIGWIPYFSQKWFLCKRKQCSSAFKLSLCFINIMVREDKESVPNRSRPLVKITPLVTTKNTHRTFFLIVTKKNAHRTFMQWSQILFPFEILFIQITISFHYNEKCCHKHK